MFGFRRKSEGFEWREYVRTTVLMRRKARHERVIQVREAAAAGVRRAGVAGARGLVEIMKTAASAAKAQPRKLIKAVTGGLSPLLTRVRSTLDLKAFAPALGPIGLLVGAAAAVGALHAVLGGRGAAILPAAVVASSTIGWALALAAMLVAVLLVRRSGLGLSALAPIGTVLKPVGAIAARVPRPVRRGLVVALIALPAGWLGWLAWRGTPPTATLASMGIPFLAAPAIEGRATAVGGDIVKIDGREVRLAGIEAPHREQRCTTITGAKWRCGEAATEALSKALRNRTIVCQPSGSDEAGRPRATCRAGNEDIAARLVREGAVFALSGMFASYAAEEREAKARKAGIWRGASVERPAEWRAKLWETARKAAPDGCPIKGQVSSSGRKTYLVPWSADYESARVRASRGERWFCSEAEATSAGFKLARGS